MNRCDAAVARLAATLILAALALAGCGDDDDAGPARPVTAAKARPGLAVGLAVNLRDGDAAYRRLSALQAKRSGVRLIRDDFSWEVVEAQPGQYDWREPDAVVSTAARRGLRVLPVLTGAPRWATGRRRGSYDLMPRDPATFAAFTARVVDRYGPGGSFWASRPELDAGLAPRWFELFNEPYGLSAAEGGPEIAAYARAAAAAVSAGREANPRARYLLAGETTSEAAKDTAWLDGLYDAVPGFERYVDGVAVHPYPGPRSPAYWTPGGDERGQTRRIERIRETLVRRGNASAEVWLTEIGWSTCPDGDACVSERQQAAYLAELFRLARTRWPWVGGVVVFSLSDYGAPRDAKEGWFGLLHDGRPKPGWAVLQQVTGVRRGPP